MTVSLADLRPGDVVLVRSGARVPADGEIVEGDAELDESMITGESRPVAKSAGDTVVAGTVSTDSAIRVRVEAVGDDTALAGIQRLVAEAQSSRSRAQALADRFAALLFYVAAGAGVVTFLVWLALGDTDNAVVRTVTVLVIACPHALGLAIPLVISLSTAVSARAGILVKDRLALERMRTIDAVLFDKTGTLTEGRARGHRRRRRRRPRRGRGAADRRRRRVRQRAPARPGDRRCGHGAGRRRDCRRLPVPHRPGRRGDRRRAPPTRSADRRCCGNAGSWCRPSLTAAIADWQARGAAVLYLVATATDVIGAFALEDEVRPEAREAVADLQRWAIKVVMITGDARRWPRRSRADLGIDEVFAEVLPEDKDQAVAELQDRGADGGDGRRRRERRPGAGPGRRRHRDRRRHRRRHRVGRRSSSPPATRGAWSA